MNKPSKRPVMQSRQVNTDLLFTKWIRYGDLAASDGSRERLRFGKFVQNPGCKVDVGKRSCSSSSSCEGTQDSLWSTWWPTWPAGLTENGEEITMLWTTREFVMKYTLGIIDKQTNGQMPRWDNYHLKALKIRNTDVKILTKDFSTAQGAQKRLRDRSSSNSSVQYLYKMRGSQERGGERGTTSRTTAWTSSTKVAKATSVRDDSGDHQAGSHGEALRHIEVAEDAEARHDSFVSGKRLDKISTQEKTGVKLETGGTCQCLSLRVVIRYLVIVYISIYLAQFTYH